MHIIGSLAHFQTFERLRPLSVTTSRRTVLRLLQVLGRDHDLQPLRWKGTFEAGLSKKVHEVSNCVIHDYTYEVGYCEF